MTQEDKDAALGRIVRERKEAQEQFALLNAEARRVGDELATLAGFLQGQPSIVVFEGEPVGVEYSNLAGGRIFHRKDINADAIIKLTNEIREINDKVRRLTEEARRFGV